MSGHSATPPAGLARRCLLLMPLLLAACAGLGPLGDARTLDRRSSGRIAVRVEADAAKSMSASFDLRGDAHTGLLELSSPLGTQLARATWRPGAVELLTTEGRRSYAGLDDLAEDAFGQPVPLVALLDWLEGRAWPGAPAVTLGGDTAGFTQLGWKVELARQAQGIIVARRDQPAPAITLTVRLDRD